MVLGRRIVVLSLAALGVSSAAHAADERVDAEANSETNLGPRRGMDHTVAALLNLGYAYSAGTGMGVSGRYQVAIVPEGVLRSDAIRDELGVEGAVDFFHYSWDIVGVDWTYNEFTVSGSLVWNLWFNEHFAAYPRLGIGFGFGSFSSDADLPTPGGYGGVGLVAAAGVLYELDALTLRAEAGNAMLGVGAAISL